MRRSLMLPVVVALALAGGMPAAPAANPTACYEGRQTPDPISPACEPFFDGENGGATAPGVTSDEVLVVLYNDECIAGDLSAPYRPSDECGRQIDGGTANLVRTAKAYAAYFNAHFQTFNRSVRVVGVPARHGTAPGDRRNDAGVIAALHSPFAVATLTGPDGMEAFFEELAEHRVPSFSLSFDLSHELLAGRAPYVWSFYPDRLTETDLSASFICEKLVGRRARFSSDDALASRPRVIGMVDQAPGLGAPLSELAGLLRDRVRERCAYEIAHVETVAPDASLNAALVMRRMQEAGITTVVCYCLPTPPSYAVTALQTAATALGFFPEWYFDHASAMDRPVWQQLFLNRAQRSFGSTWLWRQPPAGDRPWVRAYVEATGDGTAPNDRYGERIYLTLMQVFAAVQTGGANLTVASMAEGLFGYEFRDPTRPFSPSGGYGHGGAGPYTWVDSGMAWWWDSSGGAVPGGGCMRLANEGRRAFAGGWTPGDDDLFRFHSADPCM